MARVVGQQVIADSGPGKIRAVLTAHGSALALFSQHDQNEGVRQALARAGAMWIDLYLPLRFQPYAKTLGYSAGSRYTAWKQKTYGHDLPDVLTGRTRQTALLNARGEARATSRNATLTIRIPLPANDKGFVYGNSYRSGVSQVLRRLPPREVERIAVEMERGLVEWIQGRLEERMRQPPSIGPVRDRIHGPGRRHHHAPSRRAP